jgi:hypothetical protein
MKLTLAELKKKIIEDEVGEVVVFDCPDYADAFVGYTDGEENQRAVYEYNKMVEHLVADGMTYEDAVEFIDYNTLRAMPYYPEGPIIINTPDWREDYE